MRRVLFPLLVIGLAAGLFSLGSGAFFSDVEQDTDNTITAGTLDLEIDTEATTSCSIANYSPVGGDLTFDPEEDNCVSAVENVGSLSGDLWLQIDITNTQCSGGGEFCPGEGEGSLGDELTATECAEGGTGTIAGGPPNPCDSITNANSLAFACTLVAVLDAGETYSLTFDLTDTGVTNASQGDSLTIDFLYELVQSGQTADCTGTE